MSLLDLVLGDRAGTLLLASCLLVATLAIIAAILDLPLRSLHEAGYARKAPPVTKALLRVLQAIAGAAALLSFAGAAMQAFLASAPYPVETNFLLLWLLTNGSFVVAVAILGLAPPLTRHWGLGLGAFGLGLATLFLLLAAVLQLPFTTTGELQADSARWLFAVEAGLILFAIGICVSAILSLLARIIRSTAELASEYRRNTDWLTSDWNTTRKLGMRHLRSRRTVAVIEPPQIVRSDSASRDPNEAEAP
jgi:hypothetical protein